MDYTAADFWWKVTITLMNMGIGVYLFWERNNNATKNRIDGLKDDVDTRLDTHTKQLAALDEHINHTPTHKDLSKLYERMTSIEHRLGEQISNVGGAVKRIEGESSAQTRILNLVYESLVNK